MEYDADDVLILCFLHRRERHLLVPIYFELPVIRRLPVSSRVPERKIALLPPEARATDWVNRGAAMHDGCFDKMEIAFEDEIRRHEELADTPAHHVFDVLRSIPSGWGPGAVAVQFRKAARRSGLGAVERRIPRQAAEIPVNLFGFFLADTGVGESTRGLARAVGLLRPVQRLTLCTGHLQPDARLEQLFHHYDYLSDVNVFASYPHAHEDLFGTLPPAYFRHRRNIVHLAWEQRDWNHHWKSIYQRYDEIWAISEFAAEPFRRMFGNKVRVVAKRTQRRRLSAVHRGMRKPLHAGPFRIPIRVRRQQFDRAKESRRRHQGLHCRISGHARRCISETGVEGIQPEPQRACPADR